MHKDWALWSDHQEHQENDKGDKEGQCFPCVISTLSSHEPVKKIYHLYTEAMSITFALRKYKSSGKRLYLYKHTPSFPVNLQAYYMISGTFKRISFAFLH